MDSFYVLSWYAISLYMFAIVASLLVMAHIEDRERVRA